MNFLDTFSKNTQISKVMKIRSLGAETDRTTLIVAFRIFQLLSRILQTFPLHVVMRRASQKLMQCDDAPRDLNRINRNVHTKRPHRNKGVDNKLTRKSILLKEESHCILGTCVSASKVAYFINIF